jgi:threonylcarbamoyladenosine tRNA methylthiotransferase MtaB
MGFSQIHVFKYSPRRRTAAAKHPDQVPEEAKRERTEVMLGVAAESARRFREARIGETLDVLFEQRADGEALAGEGDTSGGDTWEGLADNYVRVLAASGEPLANERRWARVVGLHPDGVMGELAV